MKKHSACICLSNGWVDIDINNYKSINCVTRKLHETILDSNFYKNKEGIFWPRIKKNQDYKSVSNTDNNIISYYETEYIHHITRYPEFTPNQLKESLLFLADVCIYCKENNYFILTHLWNVTFKNGHPFMIDIRDFEIYSNQKWNKIFLGHFRDKLDSHCPYHIKNFIVNHEEIKYQLENTNDPYEIKHIVEKIIPVAIGQNYWSNYHKERTDFLHEYESLNDELYNKIKHHHCPPNNDNKSFNLLTTIEKYQPKTIIEMGCNNGLYCFGASKHAHVVGIDNDIISIDIANKINKKLQTSSVFVCADFFKLDDNISYGQNNSYGTKIERFRSEMLIAPAIMHHLFNACKSLDKIICTFDKYAKKYMIIEHINGVYNEIDLKNTIEKYDWNIIEILDSSPAPRKYFVCEKNM